MTLEILTPDKKVFSGNVSMVTVPGTNGSFQIMNCHAAIISTLESGLVNVELNDKSRVEFNIKGGVVEVLKNKVVLLADGIVE